MDYKWHSLKRWIINVVDEGYKQGYNITEDDMDRGQFIAYEKVLRKIGEIESEVPLDNVINNQLN